MLLREGEARTNEVDRRLATTLAAIAGAVNAAAFHAVGFFSANMTGNVSALSDHLAVGGWGLALFFLGIVTAFVAGSAVSTLLINAGRRRRVGAIYAYSILLEGLLLAAIGALDLATEGPSRVTVTVLGLSFLMGLQNAVVTRISNARVRTTHVSGMLTDIGIGIGMLLDIARGREPSAGATEIKAKLRLHVETVMAFAAGGLIGVLFYAALGGGMLLAAAFLLLLIAVPPVVRSRRAAHS